MPVRRATRRPPAVITCNAVAAYPGDDARRALALSNRAACHLKLGAPLAALDDLTDVLALCTLPGERPWKRALRPGMREVYFKALLRRIAACAAAGTPLAAMPDASFGLKWQHLSLPPEERYEPDVFLQAYNKLAGGTRAPLAEGVAVRGAWSRVGMEAGAAAPSPRRCSSHCALDGFLYVFGGRDATTCTRS